MARTRPRDVVLLVGQYGVALAALAWVLTQVDLDRVATLLAGLDAPTVLALFVVSGAGLLARFYTWYALLPTRGPGGFRKAAETDLVVNFVNQLLPSRLSGRLAAPFVLRSRTGMAYPEATAVAGVHTGIYAVLYGAAALVGIAVVAGRLPIELVGLLALSTGLYVAAGALVLLGGSNLAALDRLFEGIGDRLEGLGRIGVGVSERLSGLTEHTAASSASFRALTSDPGVWARYTAGWTGALVLAPGVRVLLLFGSFGASFEPAVALPVVLVAAYSVTLLPVTPGGIGVTEATATAVFVALGIPGDVVVPVVVLDRFLGVYLPAAAGWYPSLSIDRSSLATE